MTQSDLRSVNQKRKHRSSDRWRKKLYGSRLTDRQTTPRTGGAAHGGDRSPWGRRDAKAWAAARSRIGAALISCRTIERVRDCRNLVDILLSLSARVYRRTRSRLGVEDK
jgi:hypothetical protein